MPFKTFDPKASSWQQILSHSLPIKYLLVHAGDIQMDRNDLLQKGPKEWPDRFQSLPVLSHWAQHPVHGEILIDAAFSSHFKQNSGGNYSRFMRFFGELTGVKNSLSSDLASQLPNLGSDVKQVFITHFHPDHTSGLDDLALDIPVVANVKEYDLLARITNGDLFDRRSNWFGIDFSNAIEVPPFKQVVDIYGDGSIFAIATPGHTRGHTSYLINANQGAKLIVGDASHYGFGFTNGLAPAAIGKESARQAEDSLSQLISFNKMFPQVELVLGHELPSK